MTTEDRIIYEVFYSTLTKYSIYYHKITRYGSREEIVKQGFTNKENAIRFLRNVLKIKDRFYVTDATNLEKTRILITNKLNK
jgi:hypothetical protein